MKPGGFTVDFTTEELIVLCRLGSSSTPFGLDVAAFEALPTALRDIALSSAERSLIARRIVTANGDQTTLPDAMSTLLTALCSPGLIGVVAIQDGEVLDTAAFTATPDLGVHHWSISPSVHRLEPFPTRELMSRLLDVADLRPAPVAPGGSMVVEVAVLVEAQRLAAEGERDAATAAISSTIEPGADVSAFVAVLRSSRAVTVTLLHRPQEGPAVGGALTWLDGGRTGLWTSEPIDDDEGPERVRLTPASADEIVAELFDYLPTPFASAEALPAL